MDISKFLRNIEKMVSEIENREKFDNQSDFNFEQFNIDNGNPLFNSDMFKQSKLNVHELLYDVTEYDEHVTVVLDLPGFSKDQINIQSDEMHVRVEAEATSDMRRESVSHTFNLPTEVIPAESTAEFENGVLTIELPKLDVEDDESTEINID